MNRRGFLLGFASAVALVASVGKDALAQAVECYDPSGAAVPCPLPGHPIPFGIVRRAGAAEGADGS